MKNKAVVCIPKQLFELTYVNIVHPSTETIMSYYTSFVVPRGSPLQAKKAFFSLSNVQLEYIHAFQSYFHDDIMWLRDSGILEKLKYDIKRPALPILDPKVRRDQPIILSQLGIVMIVLASGFILSLPVFLCELIKGRSNKTLIQQSRGLDLPPDREHITLNEVARLTLHHYGRSLEEYLA